MSDSSQYDIRAIRRRLKYKIAFIAIVIYLVCSLLYAAILHIQIVRCTETTQGVVYSTVVTYRGTAPTYYIFEYKVNGMTIHSKELYKNTTTRFGSAENGTQVTIKYDKDNPYNCIVVKEDWSKIYNRLDAYKLIRNTCIALSLTFFLLSFSKSGWKDWFRIIAFIIWAFSMFYYYA